MDSKKESNEIKKKAQSGLLRLFLTLAIVFAIVIVSYIIIKITGVWEKINSIEKLKSISILAKGNAVYEAAVHFAETIIPDVIMSSSGWEKVKRSNNKTFVMCYLDEFGKQIPVPEIPVVRNASRPEVNASSKSKRKALA